MNITKRVLLARPHAFIVSEMRPFLERAGYAAVKLENIEDIHSGKLGTFSGAIISTAVVSSITAKPSEVFAELRKKYPSLPVMFAGLTEFDATVQAIERIVHPLHPSAEIVSFAARTEDHPRLGGRDVFLFLNKEDIVSASAERILRRHFR